MGRPKLLLPWGKTTAIGQILSVWRQVGAGQVAAVCAMDHAALLAELDRLQHPCADRIFNPDPDRGMFSSIQCAAVWAGLRPGTTHWAIVLGDQPHLRRSTLSGILGHGRHRAQSNNRRFNSICPLSSMPGTIEPNAMK